MRPNDLPAPLAAPLDAAGSARRADALGVAPLDPMALRQALGRYATGVTLVTCRAADGRPVGLTVNSFTSLSLDPPLVLWSLRQASGLLPSFEAATHFAVNVLSEAQIALSRRFASPEPDKFGAGDWHEGLARLPLLAGCIARFECAVEARHAHGDHVLYIGRVLRLHSTEGAPLVYQGRHYHGLGPAL